VRRRNRQNLAHGREFQAEHLVEEDLAVEIASVNP